MRVTIPISLTTRSIQMGTASTAFVSHLGQASADKGGGKCVAAVVPALPHDVSCLLQVLHGGVQQSVYMPSPSRA